MFIDIYRIVYHVYCLFIIALYVGLYHRSIISSTNRVIKTYCVKSNRNVDNRIAKKSVC